MYEKMKKGHDWLIFDNNYAKIGLILFAILALISAISYYSVGIWPESFYYPSEEIQALTEEGYRIIEENDFNSEYEITTTITTRTDKTKSLHLTVDGANAVVEFEVKDWESDKQEISIINKRPPNKVLYFFAVLILYLMPAFLASILITFTGIVIFYIIYAFTYLHYKFKKS